MNALVKDAHLALTKKVREFAEQEVKPVIIKFDEAEEFPVEITKKLGELKVFGMQVPKENLLGKRGMGSKIMLKTLDSGRLSVAAMGLGLAEGAFEMAKDHAKKRQQFGKPISHFQVISFKLADMAMKIENARNTLYNACWLKDQGRDFGKQAAMAKLYCSEIAKEIADEAMQIHGGYGFF